MEKLFAYYHGMFGFFIKKARSENTERAKYSHFIFSWNRQSQMQQDHRGSWWHSSPESIPASWNHRLLPPPWHFPLPDILTTSLLTFNVIPTKGKSNIIVSLLSSSKNEAGDDYKDSGLIDKAQTRVTGILSPLIMINNTVIDFDRVHYFEYIYLFSFRWNKHLKKL